MSAPPGKVDASSKPSGGNALGIAERRGNLAIVTGTAVALIYFSTGLFLISAKPTNVLSQSLVSNGKVVFGVPAAGIGAFMGLLFWSQTVRGSVRFRFMGFEFSVASAPAILWVVVFLSIILAIKIL